MPTDFGHFEEEKLGKAYDSRLLRRLYPFVRPYRLLLLGSIALVILIAAIDITLPMVTKVAIDRYIVPGSAVAAGQAGEKPETRYLTIDPQNPEAQRIIRRHQLEFTGDEEGIRIPYQALDRLSPAELRVLRAADYAGLFRVAGLFLLLVLLLFGLNFIQVQLMEYAGQQIMHDLRLTLFRHIQSRSVSFFTRNPVGRLVTRVTNDIQNMYELFTSVISVVFKDFFLLLGIAAVLLAVDLKLALICFAVLPVMAWASFLFARRAREAFRTLRIKVAEINTRFAETIEGMAVIQVFRQAARNFRRFAQLNHENYLAGMRQIQVFALFMPMVEFAGTLAVAAVIFYGGDRLLDGQMTLGTLVAFLSYMKMFFRPIRDVAEKYNILQNAMSSAERIFLIMDNQERLPEIQPAAAGILSGRGIGTIQRVEFRGVSFGYRMEEPVLRDISFTLAAGETVAVVGPTGSGKTTLINLLVRFYDPDSGSILINGRDIRELPRGVVRSQTALVMQDPFLYSGSLRENIVRAGKALSESEMDRILTLSRCRELVDRLPRGLDTELSEGGRSISSGERQLVAIARAFARDPRLLILDEATSYIDSHTESLLQEALMNLMQGRTTLIIAHRLSTVHQADRILVMRKGRIIESGSHSALLQKKGFYHKLYTLQTSN